MADPRLVRSFTESRRRPVVARKVVQPRRCNRRRNEGGAPAPLVDPPLPSNRSRLLRRNEGGAPAPLVGRPLISPPPCDDAAMREGRRRPSLLRFRLVKT